MQNFQQTAQKINSWLLPLLMLSLPASTSVVSALALIILCLWLLEGDYRDKLAEIFTNSVCIAVLLYLGLHVIGFLWTEDKGAGVQMLEKQWKLMLLPIFLTIVKPSHRRQYIFCFLAGLTGVMLLSFLAWFDIFQYAGTTPEHPTRRLFHVVYNPMLAFGFYLVMHEVLWGERSGLLRIVFIVVGLLMACNMFVTEGRAGQVAFFVMLGLLLAQYFRKNIFAGLLIAGVLLPLIFATGYKLSPNFQNRVDLVRTEVSQFSENPNSSVGLRLLFWKNSWEIIKENPVIGVGTGDFQTEYAKVNNRNSPKMVVTDNPHNQYIMVLCQFGVLGLIFLLTIFFLQIRHAGTVDDQFKRVRLAFPVFFLVIMLSESYLMVYETGFLFSLFSAILYTSKRRCVAEVEQRKTGGRCWLILSYRSNIDGSACAQHIDDRLPFFADRNIVPVMLTGPVGKHSEQWPHYWSPSIAPSGIRFEIRHFLRKRLKKRWQFKTVETLLLLPVLPFYLLEKIIINLESEWSWFFLAACRGYFLCCRYSPEVIYSTGGTASAHVAARLISMATGLPWLAETQDPLVHDHDWQRGRRVLAIYKWLEKDICTNADCFLFLTKAARDNMAARVKMPNCGRVIYPGANPDMFVGELYSKGKQCHFAHFGTLDGTRNLKVFLQALWLLIDNGRVEQEIMKVDIYGTLDEGTEKMIRELGLENIVVHHGLVARKKALRAMQKKDCLILVQNTIYFSTETIPSKVYEYLLSGQPTLGLVYNNHELHDILRESGNFSAAADDIQAVSSEIDKILTLFENNQIAAWPKYAELTVAKAVDQLVVLGEEAAQRMS